MVRNEDAMDDYGQVMSEKGTMRRETMFGWKHRPVSVHTEFMETDWEDDDEQSSTDNSPRLSLNSFGQPSMTTMSSYDEVQTPPPVAHGFDFGGKPVEGPRGPHLFGSSLSTHSAELENALSLSPVESKKWDDHKLPLTMKLTRLPPTKKRRGEGDRRDGFADEELDVGSLVDWSPEMVAQWLLEAGVSRQLAELFVQNDINGAILMTLTCADLAELGIDAHDHGWLVWKHVMRLCNKASPARQPRRRRSRVCPPPPPPRSADVVGPGESVSIVGIEQLLPEPHDCSKGERCREHKRTQRIIDAFRAEHPYVDVQRGRILVAGDPGNPDTAEALDPSWFSSVADSNRPMSDAMPSVVASSDVLGARGRTALQCLQEATLPNMGDPQEKVRQFLDFQCNNNGTKTPPTPPFEMPPRHRDVRSRRLQALPRLCIPPYAPSVGEDVSPSSSSSIGTGTDIQEDDTTASPWRHGTPFSDMDVPVTGVLPGPVARDTSQSVPPDMNYRPQQMRPAGPRRPQHARRPSFPVLPVLDEDPVSPLQPTVRLRNRPIQPPPRWQYPWTPTERPAMEKAFAPLRSPAGEPVEVYVASAHHTDDKKTSSSSSSSSPAPTHHHHNFVHHLHAPPPQKKGKSSCQPTAPPPVVSHAGLMRKRKTKMLRHEWHEHYFQLRGTRLTMHNRDTGPHSSRALEYIDVDDYAIAHSAMASSKLDAAFRAMHLRRSSGKQQHVAAFSFQLVPQDSRGGARLIRKRDSASAAVAGPELAGAVDGTGKTHHFAVSSRDERIDWMREMMLAKARKQKGDGFEVRVNGSVV